MNDILSIHSPNTLWIRHIALLATITFFSTVMPNKAPCAAAQHPVDVELSVIPDKTAYLTGESVSLIIRRVNVHTDTTSIPPLIVMTNLKIEMHGSAGRPVPYEGIHYSIVYPLPRTVVQPGDTVTEVLVLTNYFGERLVPRAIPLALSPDEYTLRIQYVHWQETLDLPPLTIQVSEPEGEERSAFQLWISAEEARLERGRQAARELLSELVVRHPSSAYFPLACYTLMILDGARSLEWAELLVHRFPNSGLVWPVLSLYITDMDVVSRETRLRVLAERHPRTLVEQFAMMRSKVDYRRVE